MPMKHLEETEAPLMTDTPERVESLPGNWLWNGSSAVFPPRLGVSE